MVSNTDAIPAGLFLRIEKQVDIEAPPEVVFESILEQLGPEGDTPDGQKMHLTLEAWPGGRWFRDMGNNAGHLWAHVQVIKPPTLLELYGPLFMSYPVISHVQYRVTTQGNTSRLSVTHRAMGDIAAEHRAGVTKGWEHIISRIKQRSIART